MSGRGLCLDSNDMMRFEMLSQQAASDTRSHRCRRAEEKRRQSSCDHIEVEVRDHLVHLQHNTTNPPACADALECTVAVDSVMCPWGAMKTHKQTLSNIGFSRIDLQPTATALGRTGLHYCRSR